MEADISTLRKTGHFYFALTVGLSKLIMCESEIRIHFDQFAAV